MRIALGAPDEPLSRARAVSRELGRLVHDRVLKAVGTMSTVFNLRVDAAVRETVSGGHDVNTWLGSA